MPEKKEIEALFRISSLNLEEKIVDLYIYKDNTTSKYSFNHNNEKKFPINLEKTFKKKFGKVKNYFDMVEDIKVQWSCDEDLVKITYFLK